MQSRHTLPCERECGREDVCCFERYRRSPCMSAFTSICLYYCSLASNPPQVSCASHIIIALNAEHLLQKACNRFLSGRAFVDSLQPSPCLRQHFIFAHEVGKRNASGTKFSNDLALNCVSINLCSHVLCRSASILQCFLFSTLWHKRAVHCHYLANVRGRTRKSHDRVNYRKQSFGF